MVYDLIIIGGGPAGITAGLYSARQRLKTLLLTKTFGGQMARKSVGICNYPGFEEISGQDLIDKFVSHLKKQEIEIKSEIEIGRVEKVGEVFNVYTSKNEMFLAKTLIVATGGDPRPLEVPGEKEFIGKGVSYCVTCDGPLFRAKKIAIVGGGNAGFEAALFMSDYAEQIYIMEFNDRPKAEAFQQELASKAKNIEVITNAKLKKIEGSQFVERLIYENVKTGEEEKLAVCGIFVEIGNQPATAFVKDLVEFGPRDEIKVEFETLATKTPGLFAAGDVNVGIYKQIVTACGEGCKASLSAYDYLRKMNYQKNGDSK